MAKRSRSSIGSKKILHDGVFKFGVTGLELLQRKLEALHREGTDLAEEVEIAVESALEMVKTRSNEICPIASGALRASAGSSVTRYRNGRLRGVVLYREPYAMHVHERLDTWHAEGTSAKFLEIAFAELQPKLAEIISKATASAIKSAVKAA